jgi:hypothetical protein
MRRACNMHKGEGNAYKVLLGKPDRKGSLKRSRHKWDNNINMDLKVRG